MPPARPPLSGEELLLAVSDAMVFLHQRYQELLCSSPAAEIVGSRVSLS